MDTVYIVVDLETTGSIPGVDEIIEIGAVKIKGTEIIDTFQTLIKPITPIPPFIQKLTGITEKMVSYSPSINEIIPEFQEFISDIDIFIAHNVKFDLSFLEQIISIKPKQIYDTIDLGRILLPFSPNYRLKTLSEYCSIPLEEHHRGFADAMATAKLFLRYIKEINALHPKVREDILNFTQGHNWNYWSLFNKLDLENKYSFTSISGKPPYPFLEPQKKMEYSLLSKTETNNVEDKSCSEKTKVIDTWEVEELLSANGPLAREYENYEFRPQQIELSKEVVNTLNNNEYLVVEAGTGTGKSLGYLIPTALWSLRTGQRVVIATHTINLQEQLIKKDIPTIINTFNLPVKTVLVKGKSNYICLRKWHNILNEGKQWKDLQQTFYLMIMVWLSKTDSGDKSELNLDSRNNEFWSTLSCDSEHCLTQQCSWYNRGCFVQSARIHAENAHILIANHSLVLTDVKTDNRVLPNYQYLIIDEAHHIESEATDHLAINVNEKYVGNLLNSLYNTHNDKVLHGLLGNLRLRQGRYKELFNKNDFEKMVDLLDKSIIKVKEIREGFNRVIEALGNLVTLEGIIENEEQNNKLLRISPDIQSSHSWGILETAQENLNFRLQGIAKDIKSIGYIFEDYNTHDDKNFNVEIRDINNHLNQITQLNIDLKSLISSHEKEFVYWIELINNKDGRFFSLKGAPIRVSEILAERLFSEKLAVILTSATLTIEDNFKFYIERIGLNLLKQKNLNTLKLPSPFNYEQNVLLCIPNDIQTPNEIDEEEYQQIIAKLIKDISVLNNGRTLVLFTSHKSLKFTYNKIKEPLTREGINLYGHNIDGNSNTIVEEFKKCSKGVLFGTNSFWEGIDIPGDNLTCVIIVKLPFQVPTVPIIEARVEEIENSQKDGFRNFILPNAVIRLKQGFGRLIRTQKDQGVVIVLDSRLITKYYGKVILNSLPIKNHIRGETNLILQKLKDWQSGERPNYDTLKILNSVDLVEKYLKRLKKVIK